MEAICEFIQGNILKKEKTGLSAIKDQICKTMEVVVNFVFSKSDDIVNIDEEMLREANVNFVNPIISDVKFQSDFDRVMSRKIELLSMNVKSKNVKGADEVSEKEIEFDDVEAEIAPIVVSNLILKRKTMPMLQKKLSMQYCGVEREVCRKYESNKVKNLLELGISAFDLKKLTCIQEEITNIIEQEGMLSYEKENLISKLTKMHNDLYEEMFTKTSDTPKSKLSDYLVNVTNYNSMITDSTKYKTLSNVTSNYKERNEIKKLEKIQCNLIDVINVKFVSKSRKQECIDEIIKDLFYFDYSELSYNAQNILEIIKLNIIKTIEINGYLTINNKCNVYDLANGKTRVKI